MSGRLVPSSLLALSCCLLACHGGDGIPDGLLDDLAVSLPDVGRPPDLARPPDLVAGGCRSDNDCGPGGAACCGGACLDVRSDPHRCGSCNHACSLPNAVAGCSQGACTIASCAAGYADCNHLVDDGCEVHLADDLGSCGACGQACGRPAHGRSACKAGQCAILACDPGYEDCDGQYESGCEAYLTGDPQNCGACGTRCDAKTCQICDLGRCTWDRTNCGACGHACPKNCEVCSQGTCIIPNSDCGGLGNCDCNPLNGCEANLRIDPQNCGACSHVCPQNQTCVNGNCQ